MHWEPYEGVGSRSRLAGGEGCPCQGFSFSSKYCFLIVPFLSTDEGQVLRHADPVGGANQGEGARGGRAARASPGAGGRSGAAGEEERVEARGR